ncbi:Oxo-4-hydroxy-4-carboxy-5-ureidoimidazoline decarboxylase [Boletus reticuloceps]|uniref:Oxo-4-hydroxy-4-carboxy-5-ureidoimidazoline decarboxylase n=1 Tax=Boletus reticuloceps TaxID=495285 RepID=A0A8I2Z000_9AGAM|nr:Oxo-4-hydroxy-4-carboxy-5-ureidoimidazoline decarboxylase [Boletus reticuloceps]
MALSDKQIVSYRQTQMSMFNDEQDAEQALKDVLVALFEYSDVLAHHLLPELLASHGEKPRVYHRSDIEGVLGRSMDNIRSWGPELRAQFIGGHPRIGETKNLSVLSSKEQSDGTSQPTPPEVLARLAHLNACYEHVYPGLRYITFVNGRSRAVIAEEMEDKLGITRSLSPDQPSVESFILIEKYSHVWRKELDRAVEDIGRIAQSRLAKLVVE